MKNLLMFLGSVLLVSAAACSSNSGSGAIACPAAGEKDCPNSTPITQDLADACNKCLSTYQAYGQCAETASKARRATADPDGSPIALF